MASAVSFLTVDKKGRATLPENVRSDLGVSSGDLVLLEKTDRGTWELMAAHVVPRDQLWFHLGMMEPELVSGHDVSRHQFPCSPVGLLEQHQVTGTHTEIGTHVFRKGCAPFLVHGEKRDG